MRLIASVQKRDGLYNVGSGGLGKEKREEAKRLWEEICEELNLPGNNLALLGLFLSTLSIYKSK